MFDSTQYPFTSLKGYDLSCYSEQYEIEVVSSDAIAIKLIYSVDFNFVRDGGSLSAGGDSLVNELRSRVEYFGRLFRFLVLVEAAKYNFEDLIGTFVASNDQFIVGIQDSLTFRASLVQLELLEMQLVGVYLIKN